MAVQMRAVVVAGVYFSHIQIIRKEFLFEHGMRMPAPDALARKHKGFREIICVSASNRARRKQRYGPAHSIAG